MGFFMRTPDEGPSLETSIFPLSFQVVREPYLSVFYVIVHGIVRTHLFRISFDFRIFSRILWIVQKKDFGHPQRKCMYVIYIMFKLYINNS